MTSPLNPAIPAPPLPTVVEQDIPCRKCSYNLRGLSIEGRCPECGLPIGLSVHGELLRYSDPNFVATLARGVSLILWGVFVVIVGSIIAAVAVAVVARGGVRPGATFIGIVPLVGNIMMVVGAWFLTAPDPSGLGEDRYGTARKIIRVALVVGLINQFVNWGLGIGPPLEPAVRLAIQTVAFAAGIVGVVGQFAQLYYLNKLALRIPNADLSQRARFLMWAMGISYGLLLVVGFVAAAFFVSRGTAAGAAPTAVGAGCFAAILGLAVLVFGDMYLFMLGRFGREFKTQAALARQVWSAAAAPPSPAA
jgi:hypothetical protein